MVIKESFNQIYTEYYNRAFRFANLYVRNDLAAEDLATEAMLKLWETMQKEPVDKAATFLLTILKHKSLDYLKMKARARAVVEAMEDWRRHELDIRISTLEACDPEKVLSDEIQHIVQFTLNQLPEQTRNVFIMSRYEDKSVKEIAERLGITVKGVDYHIAKALKALRIALKDYLPFLSFWFMN